MNLDAGAGTFAQGVGKGLADVPRPVDVRLKGDALARSFDGGQHGRKYLVAVEQLGDLVATHNARPQQAAHRTLELRAGCVVQAGQLLLHLFFARGEVECQQHQSARYQGSHKNGE
ncbi:hypothetical protein D3C71_1738160 [compost metagenome]